MKLARLRLGDVLALLGGVGLLVALALEWFSLRGGVANLAATSTGYASLGWFAVALLLFAALAAIALAVATVFERAPAFGVGLQTVAVVAGLAAVLCLAVRLLAQPDLGVAADDARVLVQPAAYGGMASAVLLLVGAWRSMADERSDTAVAHEQTARLLSGTNVDRPLPAVGEGTPW